MTNYMNYIKNIINTETEMDKDSIEKLVKIAYYMGREEAAREVSDKYSDHIAEQKQRASECRYHNMAAEIVAVHFHKRRFHGDLCKIGHFKALPFCGCTAKLRVTGGECDVVSIIIGYFARKVNRKL